MSDAGGRVFVLGSGFSASFGLPTLADLFRGIMADPSLDILSADEAPAMLDPYWADDKTLVHSALRELYPHFDTHSPPDYPPFEEFLSLLTAASELAHYEQALKDSCTSALRLLTRHLGRASESAKNDHLLDEFTDNVRPEDTIITFNWDTLVEASLRSKGKEVTFLPATRNAACTILKLHGSLGWVEIPPDAAPMDESLWVLISDRIFATTDCRPADPWVGLGVPPFIIPPIMTKQVASNGPMKRIWHSAFVALMKATELIFIGYSLPRDDLHARGLIRAGVKYRNAARKKRLEGGDLISPNDKLVLINPDPAVLGHYTTVVSSDVEYWQTRFTPDSFRNVVCR